MSSRKVHNTVGGAAGGVYALVHAPSGQPTINNIAEVLGGIVGGVGGSRLPDIFEPAIHSHHRSTMHSVAFAGGVATAGLTKGSDVAAWCRTQAAAYQQRAVHAGQDGNVLAELFYKLLELLLHFGAGIANGIPAGYLSHLACDMTTPRSIPLFTRGF